MFAVMDCLAWAISSLQNFFAVSNFFLKQDQVHIYTVHRHAQEEHCGETS